MDSEELETGIGRSGKQSRCVVLFVSGRLYLRTKSEPKNNLALCVLLLNHRNDSLT